MDLIQLADHYLWVLQESVLCPGLYVIYVKNTNEKTADGKAKFTDLKKKAFWESEL